MFNVPLITGDVMRLGRENKTLLDYITYAPPSSKISSFTSTLRGNGVYGKRALGVGVGLGEGRRNITDSTDAYPTPLNFYTFDPIYVVPFLISGKILRILRGSGINILCTLCHLHALGLGARLVTELDQSHQHGQAQTAHQDVEHTGHVAQAERTRLLLEERTQNRRKNPERVAQALTIHSNQ